MAKSGLNCIGCGRGLLDSGDKCIFCGTSHQASLNAKIAALDCKISKAAAVEASTMKGFMAGVHWMGKKILRG